MERRAERGNLLTFINVNIHFRALSIRAAMKRRCFQSALNTLSSLNASVDLFWFLLKFQFFLYVRPIIR